MASLIIVLKTPELEYIDLTRGQYLFGISNLNESVINNNTYQLGNRFDGLTPGIYHWSVKNIDSGNIMSRGKDTVVGDSGNCYTHFVTSSNTEIILQTTHKLLKVSDIECFYSEGREYFKFLPDTAVIDVYGNVTVTTNTPFNGKITIC